jgi:hypothetical protein
MKSPMLTFLSMAGMILLFYAAFQGLGHLLGWLPHRGRDLGPMIAGGVGAAVGGATVGLMAVRRKQRMADLGARQADEMSD